MDDEPTTEWVTVEVSTNRGMAEVSAGMLRGADIPYRIVADDGQGQGLPLGLSTAGAELQVPGGHADDAWVLLGADEQSIDAPDADVSYEGSSTLATVALLVFGSLLVVLFVIELIGYLT